MVTRVILELVDVTKLVSVDVTVIVVVATEREDVLVNVINVVGRDVVAITEVVDVTNIVPGVVVVGEVMFVGTQHLSNA